MIQEIPSFLPCSMLNDDRIDCFDSGIRCSKLHRILLNRNPAKDVLLSRIYRSDYLVADQIRTRNGSVCTLDYLSRGCGRPPSRSCCAKWIRNCLLLRTRPPFVTDPKDQLHRDVLRLRIQPQRMKHYRTDGALNEAIQTRQRPRLLWPCHSLGKSPSRLARQRLGPWSTCCSLGGAGRH